MIRVAQLRVWKGSDCSTEAPGYGDGETFLILRLRYGNYFQTWDILLSTGEIVPFEGRFLEDQSEIIESAV